MALFLPGLEVVLAEFVTVGYCFEPSFALCVFVKIKGYCWLVAAGET